MPPFGAFANSTPLSQLKDEKSVVVGAAGPFKVITQDIPPSAHSQTAHHIPEMHNPETLALRRRHECPNYSTCLDLAAALDWDNFTCRGCSGEVNPALIWQARVAESKDPLVSKICALPKFEHITLSRDQEGRCADESAPLAGLETSNQQPAILVGIKKLSSAA